MNIIVYRMTGEELRWVVASRCGCARGWRGSTGGGGGFGVAGANEKLWLARREALDACVAACISLSEESNRCEERRGLDRIAVV
eukprot:SAG11_NODE_110_length_16199_cov_18.081180_12_plen_84_part_00